MRKHSSALLLIFYCAASLSFLLLDADAFVRPARVVVRYILFPTHEVVFSSLDRFGEFGKSWGDLLRAHQRWSQTRDSLENAQLNLARLASLEEENDHLRLIMGLPPRPGWTYVPSRIIARDPKSWNDGFILNRGHRSGVRRSHAVVAIQGGEVVLVGQIMDSFDTTATAVFLTDPLCAFSAEVERTQDQGVVEGFRGGHLRMKYLLLDSHVTVGDKVKSLGLGGVLPRGIAVGTIEEVRERPRESFLEAFLSPKVNRGILREVVVLVPENRP